MIKIIIVDDSLIIRNGLKTVIEQDNEIEVVGLAANGLEALELCDKYSPDLVLMDIKMPVCDGVEGTKLVKNKYNYIKVIILTTFDDHNYISDTLKYGADGYILKDIGDKDLTSTIKSTVNGFSTVPRSIFSTLSSNFTSNKFVNTKTDPSVSSLTGRELEIIRLIVDGKGNKEIAAALYLVEGTVRNTIHAILNKLRLKDRTQLAVFAIKNDLV